MTPSGGKRKGAGRPPSQQKGRRAHIIIAPDLVDRFCAIPERHRSEFVNQAIREKLERERG